MGDGISSYGDIDGKNYSYDDINFDNADNLIAKQLHSLPYQDRNDINEEIHGVQSISIEETPEMIEASLMQLAVELHNLPEHYKLVYLKASAMKMYSNKKEKNTIEDASNDIQRINADKDNLFFGDEYNHFSSPQCDPPLSSHPATPSSFCYVKSREFQLVFLRCEFFNASKAALRLVKYLELAYEVYGEEALRRPLRAEEIEIFCAGNQQLLPFRDKSGRRVLALHGDLSLPSSSLNSLVSRGPGMKIMLYLWSVLMEDVDAQRKGLVVVFWPRCMKNRIARTCAKQKNKDTSSATTKSNGGSPNHTKYKKRKRNTSYDFDSSIEQTALALPDEDLKWIGKRFFEAIPIRMCAIHICLPDKPCFRMIRYFFLLVMGEKNRTRVKTHQGHGKEVLDSLMGYGIPVNTLPFNELTQTVKTNNQAIFLRVRRKIEAEFYCDTNNSNNYVRVQHSGIVSENSSDESTVSDENSCMSLDMIECPSMNDVIFRAGKSYMSHPGNMMFRELIETHITEHNAASQGRKQKLTWQVIQEVEMKGGRFLEYNRALETWTALTDRGLLRHKIATHFKEYRRKLRASLRSSNAPGSSMVKFEAPDDDRRGKRTKIEV